MIGSGVATRAAALAVGLGALDVAAARAQLPALPQYMTIYPKIEIIKLLLFADYGGGGGAIAGRHFIGGQVLFDMPNRYYASVGAGALLFNGGRVGAAPGVAATLARQFPHVPRLFVAVAQTGIGYVAFGDSAGARHYQVDIPLAFGAGAYGAVPTISWSKLLNHGAVTPWIAPRAQLRYVRVTGSPATVAGWRAGFGTGLGVSIMLHSGWCVRAAYDRLWIEDPSTGRTRAEAAIGAGLVHVGPLPSGGP